MFSAVVSAVLSAVLCAVFSSGVSVVLSSVVRGSAHVCTTACYNFRRRHMHIHTFYRSLQLNVSAQFQWTALSLTTDCCDQNVHRRSVFTDIVVCFARLFSGHTQRLLTHSTHMCAYSSCL